MARRKCSSVPSVVSENSQNSQNIVRTPKLRLVAGFSAKLALTTTTAPCTFNMLVGHYGQVPKVAELALAEKVEVSNTFGHARDDIVKNAFRSSPSHPMHPIPRPGLCPWALLVE